MIIYLDGFRSGPQSWKSRSLKARMDALAEGAEPEQLYQPQRVR